jgi:tetratricopeptide (TPR) repeat protein
VMKYIVVIIVSFFTISLAVAQPKKISEKEALLQGAFIDAAMWQNLEKYEKAEKIYADILDKDAKNATANYELARLYGATKRHEKALQNAKIAVDNDKENTWYKLLYAEILGYLGKFKESATIYESLTKIEPNNEYYYFVWAESLGASGNKEKAVKAFDQLEKKIGVDEDVIRQKHVLYLELGETRKAEKELEKLVYNFPENTDYLHLLAGFYKQIGDREKEANTYRRILSISASDAKANLALAAFVKNSGNKNDYFNSLKPIFSNKEIPLDNKVKELIPYANKVAGNNDLQLANDAIELVKILEAVHPNEAKVYAIYGDLLYHSKRSEEALKMYEKTLSISGNVYSVWEQTFFLLEEKKDYDGLLKKTEAALEIFPNQANVYYYNGIANSGKGKYADAVSSFDQVALMSSKNARMLLSALYQSGKNNFANKNYDIAQQKLLKALPIGGEQDAAVLELLGDVYSKNNQLAEAINYWKQAKTKGSKSTTLDRKIAEQKWVE